MTRTPADWRRLDQQFVWHPFTQMRQWEAFEPLIIDHAEGFHLIDVDGRRYLDGHSSLWVNIHGHGHRKLVDAIGAQARRLDHSTLLGLGNTPSIALAERLVDRAPASLARVFYSDSGSTAMEIAIKMAFQYWQLCGETARRRFVTFTGAYHGDTIGSVSVGGIDLFHSRFRPLLFDALQCPWPRPFETGQAPDVVRDACLDELDRLLGGYSGEIAAIVCECHLQAADGIWVAPDGWMSGVQALARKHDVLLIVDEVATGFCRTGRLFGCELEGIEPDLMAVAKGLTGGTLPLAATLTSQRIYDAFLGRYDEMKHFFHGHTYTGNPIACAAALANIDLIDESRLLDALPERIAFVQQRLERCATHPHVGDVRQLGLMIGLHLVADRDTGETFPVEWCVPQRIVEAARARGAVIRPLGPVMVLMPPPAMPESLLEELIDITIAAIDDVTADPEPR